MNCEVGSAGPFQGKRSTDENHYCVAYKPVYIFCIHFEVSLWETFRGLREMSKIYT